MEEAKERIAWLRLHAPLGNPNHSRTIEYNELKEQVEKRDIQNGISFIYA